MRMRHHITSYMFWGKTDLDDHVKVGELAKVLIGDLAGVGSGRGH